MSSIPLILLLMTLPQISSNENRLLVHLLKDNSRHVRPVRNISTPVLVTFGFELVHILSLVESDQTFTVKIWMRMSWVNEVLKWDPTRWGNITVTKMNYVTIWTPDIFLQEDIDEEMSSGPQKYKTQIVVNHNGTHTWMIPVLLQSSCIVDVTSFPFDRQHCQLIFNSWTHDQTELDVKHDERPIVTHNYINSTEWKLLGVERQILPRKYACCTNPFVDIVYTIRLDRKSLYYVHNIVVPCIIQMVVILFTFFLPPDCGERIGVVITVLLVFAVYLQVVSGSLPKTSTTTPALSKFYIVAMSESACSLIATCIVLAIHFKGAEKGVLPMPPTIKKYFIDYLAKFFCMKKNYRGHTNEELMILNRIERENESEIESGFIGDSMYSNIRHRFRYGADEADEDGGLRALRDEVRVITTLIHDQNNQDEVEEEWQLLAKVVDRIFFIIFFITYVVSTLLILFTLYLYRENIDKVV